MNWYYELAGQPQGPISESEFESLIAEGRIMPNTLVWKEGMADWRPLQAVRPPASPAMQNAPFGTPTVPPPAADSVQCASCGRFVPASEVIQIGDRRICATCKPAVLQGIQQGMGVPSVADLERNGPAWEQRESLGTVKAAWETVKGVLVDPSVTFSRMKRTGGLGSPISFLLMIAVVAFLVMLIYNIVIFGAMQTRSSMPVGGVAFGAAFVMGVLIWIPFVMGAYLLAAFVFSGIYHAILMMLNGANQPYETTFRVVCFCMGSGAAVNFIPGCGGLIGFLWAIVVTIIGLAQAHETAAGKSAAAVLLPGVLCCVGITVFVLTYHGLQLPTDTPLRLGQ